MGFSSILDISSFFIGMIINLIFVALMCYYFKRKYDYLYEAQCEQSKIIYQLLHKPSTSPSVSPPYGSMDYTCDPLVKSSCGACVSDSESDSDSESVDENMTFLNEDALNVPLNVEMEDLDQEIHPVKSNDLNSNDLNSIDLNSNDLNSNELRSVELEDTNSVMNHITVEEVILEPQDFTVTLEETTYSKMSMKQLKDLLSSKGIKVKPNSRKDDLIELITNTNANVVI